jgi:beta-glucanase (GH16 family)
VKRWAVAAAILMLATTGCAGVPDSPPELSTLGSYLPGSVSRSAASIPAVSSPATRTSGPHSRSGAAPRASSRTDPTATQTSIPRGTRASWEENFNGPADVAPDPALFQYRSGGNGWGNQELETYTKRTKNASLDGKGNLQIRAVRETFKGTDGITRQWTSARLDSLDKWAFTTGTVAIRMKVPVGVGLWPAFWLLGTDIATAGWPNCGEIDVVEAMGGYNGVFQTIHGPNGTKAGYQYSSATQAPKGVSVDAAYHVFSVTRSSGRIEFGIDGKRSGVITPKSLKKSESWSFDKPMFLVINLAVGGWPGLPTVKTPPTSSLVVDWIHYYPLGARQ